MDDWSSSFHYSVFRCSFTVCGGPIGRAGASLTGDDEFGSGRSQTNDLENCYLLTPSLVPGLTRIGQGLSSSVSE